MTATGAQPVEIYRDFSIRIEGEAVSLKPLTDEATIALAEAKVRPTWGVRARGASGGLVARAKAHVDDVWIHAKK